ncbi:MAG: hypothetical protein CMN02_00525 [Roseibacillus sp.]|nr:hypothetical protein [Roseibacillus sp.]
MPSIHQFFRPLKMSLRFKCESVDCMLLVSQIQGSRHDLGDQKTSSARNDGDCQFGNFSCEWGA